MWINALLNKNKQCTQYSCFFAVNAARTIAMPKDESMINEVLRLVRPATNPIIGGPINNPIMPIEDTAAMATGGGKVRDLPARLKTRGTPGDTPMPTKNIPKTAGRRYGNRTATSSPDVMLRPQTTMIFSNPNFCENQSVRNLTRVIETINAVYPAPVKEGSAAITFLK